MGGTALFLPEYTKIRKGGSACLCLSFRKSLEMPQPRGWKVYFYSLQPGQPLGIWEGRAAPPFARWDPPDWEGRQDALAPATHPHSLSEISDDHVLCARVQLCMLRMGCWGLQPHHPCNSWNFGELSLMLLFSGIEFSERTT